MKSAKKVIKGLAVFFTAVLIGVGLWDLIIMDVVPLVSLGKFALLTAAFWLIWLFLNAGSLAKKFNCSGGNAWEIIKNVIVLAIYFVSGAAIVLGGIRFLTPTFLTKVFPAGNWKWLLFGGILLVIGYFANRWLLPDEVTTSAEEEEAEE